MKDKIETIKHECTPLTYCICGPLDLEPREHCPKHGYIVPNRCGICGRFMKAKSPIQYIPESN